MGIPPHVVSPPETGFTKVLKGFEILVAPAVLAEIISRFFHSPEWIQAGSALITFGVCALIVYKGYLRAATRYLGALLTLFLAIVLVVVLIRHKTSDPVAVWGERIIPIVDQCKDSDICIADAFSSEHLAVPSDLTSDLRAAGILMQNQHVKDMVYRDFGITDSFYGTGLSQPNFDKNNYGAARIPEFLSPNYADTITSVWTWKLQPKEDNLNKKLSEILKTLPPLVARSLPSGTHNFLQYINENFKQHLSLNDSVPIVIRFAQIPANRYSGCMGRPEARRVFASHLGELLGMDMTVEEAASFSGYLFTPGEAEQTIFIWVFIPSTQSEVVPATWGAVMPRFRTWISDPKTCH